MTIYNIEPMGAVRLSRQDKFAPSKRANKYFRYGADIRALGVTMPEVPRLVFTLPMPPSWSKKKKDLMRGKPHLSKPDCDNLLKGLQDSIYYKRDDAHVWCGWMEKRWGDEGSIEITELPAEFPAWLANPTPFPPMAPRKLMVMHEER